MCAPRGVRVLRGARKGAEAVCRLPFALLPRRRLFGLTRAITPLSVLAAGGGGSGWVSPRRPLPPSLPSAVCHWGISKGVCLPEITQLPSVPLAAAYRAGYCQSPPQKSYSIFFSRVTLCCVLPAILTEITRLFFFPFLFFFPQRSASFWASPEVSHKIRQLFVPQFCTGRFQRVPIPNNPTPPTPPPQTKKSHMSFIQ